MNFDSPAMLFFIGVATGLYAACSWKRLLYGCKSRLMARHERQCETQNRRWRGRFVREARTGRVGYCSRVCMRDPGWRGLLRPHWTADVVTVPHVVWLMTEQPPDLMTMMVRSQRIAAECSAGAVTRWPVAAMTLAPQSDEAAFRQKMKEVES